MEPTDPPRRLSEENLGEKVSAYFRIHGDPEHPFSEVVGLLQAIDRSSGRTVYRITRRSGEVVEVPEADVLKLKMVPPPAGPVRPQKSWSGFTSPPPSGE
ncbi:MAG: hypothetical protein ACRDIU_02955 [Actinomycetota bacterium]